MVDFLLQAIAAILSMLAGLFWMTSAYGSTIDLPWRRSHKVSQADLPAHQTKWNGRAALCASVAAAAQAFSVLYHHPLPPAHF